MRTHVLVAGPDPVLRAGLRSVLQPHFPVVADVGSYEDLLALVHPTRAQVCLVADTLPGELGAGVQALVAVGPGVAVVVMTQDRHAPSLSAAVRAGALGYLVDDIDPRGLALAIAAVASGEAVIPRRLVGRLLEELSSHRQGARDDGPHLTQRERQVLDLLRAGRSTSQIAQELVVAPVTVRTHVAGLMRKLQATNRNGLVVPRPRRPVGVEPYLNANGT